MGRKFSLFYGFSKAKLAVGMGQANRKKLAVKRMRRGDGNLQKIVGVTLRHSVLEGLKKDLGHGARGDCFL